MGAAFCVASIGLAFSSCERIYEDLDPCPHGVSLRFIYDYNMEYANAFPKQVDCLTLYIYDDKGNYVDTKTVTGTELQDENYRMKLNLEKGNYHFVAYGGLACDEKTFSVVQEPASGSKYTDLRVEMDKSRVTATVPKDRKLHDIFWGELSLATADLYSEGTVEMMKNTNNIRIVLQQLEGGTVNADDFDFEITDNNSLFNYDNDLLTGGIPTVTYTPWTKGQAQTGVTHTGSQATPIPVEVAYAELSTSRLMKKNNPHLVVKRRKENKSNKDGKDDVVINIPLNEYLLLTCSEYYKMGDQEYLDRESRWTLFFFLQENGNWWNVKIVVNDWVVRINDVEL